MKHLAVLLMVGSFAVAHAGVEYLGLYMGGGKIGYSSYSTHPDTLDGKRVSRADSKTVMNTALLGQEMRMEMEGTTWTNDQGRPLRIYFKMTSSGRTQTILAVFSARSAEIDLVNAGQKSHKSVPIPAGATIVDDPLGLMVGDKFVPGAKRTIYVLDPMTVAFMKTEIVFVGKRSTTVKGKKLSANLVQIVDPRVTTDVYVSAKGDLVKAEAIGIEMIPESRVVAMAENPSGYRPSADLAFATSIRPDKTITDPDTLTGLTLRISGRDLARIPSDGHQTVMKDGGAWKIEVHPPLLDESSNATIVDAARSKPEYLKASMDMPSGSPVFTQLAAKIVAGETKVVPAALAIKAFVNTTMRPNAGIGVLRDAREVLQTKEGVCRDYAILTATLMRAAGIPARLASGVVNFQGDFYYHAWVEIWDGSHWLGIDSTVPQKQLSAAHVKLAEGNVEDAFAFTFLDRVKIEVLDLKRASRN